MTTDTAREGPFRGFIQGPGRRWWLVAGTLLLITALVLLSIATRLTPHVRDEAVTALNSRFKSIVDLSSLQVSAFPRPEISGEGVSVRHNGRTDVPPLIKIASFSASAGLFGLIGSPVRLRTLELDRLEISLPPGGLRGGTPPSDPAPVDGGSKAGTARRNPSERSLLVIDKI